MVSGIDIQLQTGVPASSPHASKHEKGGDDGIGALATVAFDKVKGQSGTDLLLEDDVAPLGTYTLEQLAERGGVRIASDYASGSDTGGIQEAIDDLP